MKNILTVFKKEWDRVIKDTRLVIMVMLIPGLMIYIIYSLMGTLLQNQAEKPADIAVVNLPVDFQTIYAQTENEDSLNLIEIDENEISHAESMIDDKEWTMLLVFPEGIDDYDGVAEKPLVKIYFNPNDINSSSAQSRFMNYLITYQNLKSLELYGDTNFFLIQQNQTESNEGELMGAVFGQLLPMLVIMFLFSGAMSIGPEAIAGEKERGTIATILITPIKRKELALGKILALSVLSMLSAASSFLGIILSLPKLINNGEANIDIYSFNDYLLIFIVLFSTIFVIVGIISILSAYAKSVKEAGAYITPIYILTIIISIGTSFSGNTDPSLFRFIIPIYNSIESLKAIMMFSDNALVYTMITLGVNMLYLAIFVSILNKMFNNEKIMFAK
mgnify:CR=1 FL=1